MIGILLVLAPFAVSRAQTPEAKILRYDSLFWNAYNRCDLESFGSFFSEDVEFYHDKGGMTFGLQKLVSGMKTNLCSGNGFGLRRAAVEGSVKVFLMHQSDSVYGAIISGEHVFYILEQGKPERLDGQAKFTHLWLLKEEGWKMTRVLSYDHGPATYINKRKAIAFPPAAEKYAGTYAGPQTAALTIQQEHDGLVLVMGDRRMVLYPESELLFFTRERDLTFQFKTNAQGKVSGMTVRERGAVVEELVYKGAD